MQLLNLVIDRIVIHEVFTRINNAPLPVTYGTALESLDGPAMDALRQRVVAAMQDNNRCIQMSIGQSGAGSMMALAGALADADANTFLNQSGQVADLLASAQLSRTMPGGLVIVFTGTHGVPAQRVVGVIKADVHNGFTREEVGGVQSLKFLTKLLLTYKTKLYKVGMFVEARPTTPDEFPAAWDAYLYDETLTPRNKYDAARYFYEHFLGCVFPESSARDTKQFHDLTKSFIHAMDIEPEEKLVLQNALVTYLRAAQLPTVSVAGFGAEYLQEGQMRDAYGQHMSDMNFPADAINKDLSDVDGSLRLRKLSFGNDIKITGPAAGFDDLILIETFNAPVADQGAPIWTRVTIKDRISKSE